MTRDRKTLKKFVKNITWVVLYYYDTTTIIIVRGILCKNIIDENLSTI